MILTDIPLPPETGPNNLAITSDGSQVYVSGITTVVINTATNTIAETIPLPAGTLARGIALVPDGSRAYATTADSSVTVVNLTNNTFFTTLPAGGLAPASIAITPILLF